MGMGLENIGKEVAVRHWSEFPIALCVINDEENKPENERAFSLMESNGLRRNKDYRVVNVDKNAYSFCPTPFLFVEIDVPELYGFYYGFDEIESYLRRRGG